MGGGRGRCGGKWEKGKWERGKGEGALNVFVVASVLC